MSNTWMIDGKPGRVLGLVAKCAEDAGVVPFKESRQVGDHYSVAAMERAARIFCAKGLVVSCWTSEEIVEQVVQNDKGTNLVIARARYHMRIIADDGSYLEGSAVGASIAHGGKHFSQARTDGRKELLRAFLQMAHAEGDAVVQALEEPREDEDGEAWTETLRTCVAAIDACANFAELLEVAKHTPEFKQLTVQDRARAQIEFRRRQRVIEHLSGKNYADAIRSRR